MSKEQKSYVITGANLYVFPEDLGNLTYSEAVGMCRNVNAVNLYGYNDWRVPTLEELQIIYQNRLKLSELPNGYYISSKYASEKYGCSDGYSGVNFTNGSLSPYSNDTYSCNRANRGQVRLVRTDK